MDNKSFENVFRLRNGNTDAEQTIYMETHDILFITRPSVQSSALVHHLTRLLPVSVTLHDIKKPLMQRLPKGTIIMFDMAVANKKMSTIWRDTLRKQCENPSVLLINLGEHCEPYELTQWPSLKGVFRSSEDETQLTEGLQALLRGEGVADQPWMQMLTNHMNSTGSSASTVPLTDREHEILQELCRGATNMDIARALFISENTVRTHLYNVFRKLSVKNRTQAVSWVNEHLRY